VEVKKSAEVEFGCLQELDFADVYVLKWVNALCSLLNFTTDDLRDELGGELGKSAAGGFAGNNFGHLLSDGSDLRRGSIGGLLDLVRSALGEGNGENSEKVVVGSLDGDIGLNQRLPLSDKRSEFVGCEIETVKVRQAVLSLDLIDTELDLAESVVLILLEICQRYLENSTLQCVVGVLETCGSVDEGLSNISDGKGGGCLDLVPIFTGEGI